MVRASLSAALPLLAAAGTMAQQRVQGRYIVEFTSGGDMGILSDKFNNLGVQTKMNLDYKLFKGVSIEMKDLESENRTLEEIKQMPGVNVIPYVVYPAPNDKIEWVGRARADQDYSNIVRRQADGSPDNETDTFSTHVQTQVDRLRAEGITGKGIKVAIVDTGVDYNHPALGGCFGPGCLVEGGYDFAGATYNGERTEATPDDDPLDCQGHGTHVAGIVAAQPNDWGFTGAAPGAKILAYKVFGCGGGVGNDLLIAAFNAAFEAGANIITASIGGPSGWSEEPWAVVVERIVAQGVPCTVAAGNDGAEGMFYASTASNGKLVTSVGSVDNTDTPALVRLANFSVGAEPETDDQVDFSWTDGMPARWENVTLPLRAVDFNTTDEANGCEDWPEDTEDLHGKIVLIRRGTCFFVLKATNAAKFGAEYIMFYNNVAGSIQVDLAEVPGIKGAAMVAPEQGEAWIKELEAGNEVWLHMTDPEAAEPVLSSVPNTATGGLMSSFTSWGPTWELDTRPIVSGPGGQILSTLPLDSGGYGVLSGTSMATPITAGILALVMEKRGKLLPSWMYQSFLCNTAEPVLFNIGAGALDFYAPVPQQGNGLVQAYRAATTTTVLDQSFLNFNDTDNFSGPLTFTIHNLGDEELTYTMSHLGAATSYFLPNETSVLGSTFPNDMTGDIAELAFDPAEVTVAAGGRARVTVTPTPSPDLDARRIPVWSGWVNVTASDGDSYVLAYQGVTGSMHSLQVLADGYFAVVDDFQATELARPGPNATHRFELPAIGTANATAANANITNTNITFPGFQINFATGTLKAHAFLLPAGETVATAETHSELLDMVQTLGEHREFPQEWLARDNVALYWDGELGDGTFAPAGEYKWGFAALKIFGDPANPDDWELIETDSFSITYKNITEPITIVAPPSIGELEKRAEWYYRADTGDQVRPDKRSFWKRWLDVESWFW